MPQNIKPPPPACLLFLKFWQFFENFLLYVPQLSGPSRLNFFSSVKTIFLQSILCRIQSMHIFARSFFSSCVSIENSMDFLVRLVMVLTSTSFKHFSFGRSKACISIVYTRENQLISRLRMIFSFRQKQMAPNVSWLRCLRIWLWGSGGHLPISIRDERRRATF